MGGEVALFRHWRGIAHNWTYPLTPAVGMQGLMLTISRRFLDAMIEHARRESPRECCGLLAGQGECVASIYPLVNEADDPVHEFHVASGLFAPFRQMRENEEEVLAIYHSHPASAPVPSTKDIERNYYPEAAHIILSLLADPPEVRAYRLDQHGYAEIKWEMRDDR